MNKLTKEIVEKLEKLVDAVDYYSKSSCDTENQRELAWNKLQECREQAAITLDKLDPWDLGDSDE